MTKTRTLCYFEKWMDPIAPEMMAENAKNVDVSKLSFADGPEQNWAALAEAHGYQMLPSTETPDSFYVDQAFLDRCPNLLATCSSGAGYDAIDVEACTKAGVLVFNQAGSNAESVAQHALGMMLTLCKQMIQSDRAIRSANREWTRWTYKGSELTNRTLGIVGLGNVGRRTAAICGPTFNMRVIASDPYITDADFDERGAEKATLEQIMSESDFISVHCPLTEETKGMIGAAEFAMMKPHANFITTARGGVHDEVALEKALAEGRIAGAGLDVFEIEPPAADHPLLAFPNVIVSPHNAGITSDCTFNMARSTAEQWIEIFNSRRRPRLLINPEAWDLYAKRHEAILGEPVVQGA